MEALQSVESFTSSVDGDENKKNKNYTLTDVGSIIMETPINETPKKPLQKINTNLPQQMVPDTSEGLSEITDGNISSDQQSPIQGPKSIGKAYSKSFSSPSSVYSVSTPHFTPQTSRQPSNHNSVTPTPKQRSIDSGIDHHSIISSYDIIPEEGKNEEKKYNYRDDDDDKHQDNDNINILKRTCDAIGEWYKSMGNNNYYDKKNKIGLFTKWFEEGEQIMDDMVDEFDADNSSNCEYVEFHVDESGKSLFPLPKRINDNESRQIQFQIMAYCFENGSAPHTESSVANKILLNPFQDDCINLMVDDNYKQEIMEIFQKLCPKLHDIFSQEDTKKLFAVGYKHNINLLSILTDVYNRDRIKRYLLHKNNDSKPKKNLEVSEWVNNNDFIKHLTKNYKHRDFQTHIISAIESYIHRIVPKFRMPIVTIIDDDLYYITRYFVAASKFVDRLLNDGLTHSKDDKYGGCIMSNAPFQFDFCIAVAGIIKDGSTKMILPQISDNDPEETEQIEEDLIDKENENIMYYDTIGDIEKRLENEKCSYFVEEFDPNKYDNIDHKSMLYPRCLWEIYNEFITKNNIKKDKFPRGSRLCALIDRRKKITKYIKYDAMCPKNDKLREIFRNKNGDKKDDTYFWIPPNDCNKVDEKLGIREIYFDRITQCILPHKGYNQTKNVPNYKDDDAKIKYKSLREPITCKFMGGLLTFSFIVEAQDEITCYLWYQGRCIRFLPQDISQILPAMFVHSEKNKKFIKQQSNSKNNNDIKYYDRDFDHWYNKIKLQNKATKKEK